MTEQHPLIKKWLNLPIYMPPFASRYVLADDLEKKLAEAMKMYGYHGHSVNAYANWASNENTHEGLLLSSPILKDPRAIEIESIKAEIKKLNERLEELV